MAVVDADTVVIRLDVRDEDGNFVPTPRLDLGIAIGGQVVPMLSKLGDLAGNIAVTNGDLANALNSAVATGRIADRYIKDATEVLFSVSAPGMKPATWTKTAAAKDIQQVRTVTLARASSPLTSMSEEKGFPWLAVVAGVGAIGLLIFFIARKK